MVLAELGQKITSALKKLNQATVIDEKLLDEILKEIANALMLADVNIKYVLKLRDAVKTQVSLLMSSEMGGANLRKFI